MSTFGSRSRRPLGRALLLILGCLIGGLLAPPARAGFEDTTDPVCLGMGGASFAGGTVDAGSGAALSA